MGKIKCNDNECGYEPKSGELINGSHQFKEWECPKCGLWQNLPSEPTAEDRAFEAIERKQCENKCHPLLNPESKHYAMVDGVEAICRMEQMYTTEELMVWSKITAMKYRLRIGNKDEVLKESVKIDTYEAYYEYLEEKLNASRD